jgi:hypothetical protein
MGVVLPAALLRAGRKEEERLSGQGAATVAGIPQMVSTSRIAKRPGIAAAIDCPDRLPRVAEEVATTRDEPAQLFSATGSPPRRARSFTRARSPCFFLRSGIGRGTTLLAGMQLLLIERCLRLCNPRIGTLRWAALHRPPAAAIALPPARRAHASAGSGPADSAHPDTDNEDRREKAARIQAILSRAAPAAAASTAGGAAPAAPAARRPRPARQPAPPP